MGDIILRESGQTSARSFITRMLDKTTQEEKQMTAETPAAEHTPDADAAGASFHEVTDWHAIDWQKVNHTVRRPQARIVARP